MPYGVGAFALFGLGSLPAGRLGDLWGRRIMMIVFFVGLGVAALLTALRAERLAARRRPRADRRCSPRSTTRSAFRCSCRTCRTPGAVIGVNGLAGNLGIAVRRCVTGLLVKWIGWRAAFVVPGLVSIACGDRLRDGLPARSRAPSKRKAEGAHVACRPRCWRVRFAVMTAAAVTGSLLFNFTTNGNSQLLSRALPRRARRSGGARRAARPRSTRSRRSRRSSSAA